MREDVKASGSRRRASMLSMSTRSGALRVQERSLGAVVQLRAGRGRGLGEHRTPDGRDAATRRVEHTQRAKATQRGAERRGACIAGRVATAERLTPSRSC